MNEKKRVEWEDDRLFEQDGLGVQVQRLPLRWPQYSYKPGTVKDGRVLPFVRVPIERGEKGNVTHVSVVLFNLMKEAEDYIEGEHHRLEDERAEERKFEKRPLREGRPRSPVGLSGGPGSGKTARKRANKLKRQEGA